MNSDCATQDALTLWQSFSTTEPTAGMPPLQRCVEGVRKQAQSADDVLELAFKLCETNLVIGKHEYNSWQGLAVFDATSVFSTEGLGGELVANYGYDFWGFLRAINELAKRSSNPAQYQQCINSNLFSSPVDDALVHRRFESLLASADFNNLGCMGGRAKGLEKLLPQPSNVKSECEDHGIQTLDPRTHPNAFSSFGRSITYNMNGQLMVRSPFCFNVWLERPLAWLSSINLNEFTGCLQGGQLKLSCESELDTPEGAALHILLATTGAESPGRAERHFWLLDQILPLKGLGHITVNLHQKDWKPLQGNPAMAYGIKCTVGNLAESLDRLQMQLILAIEPFANDGIVTGSMALPSLSLTPNNRSFATLKESDLLH